MLFPRRQVEIPILPTLQSRVPVALQSSVCEAGSEVAYTWPAAQPGK